MYCYDIHNVVKIKSNIRGVIPALHDYFLSDELNPNLTIRIDKDFNFPKNGLRRYDRWFYGSDNGVVYYEDNLFYILKDKVLLTNLDGLTEIRATYTALRLNRASRGSVYDLIETVIDYKLIKAGLTTIHGAGLSKDGYAILLAGYPNIGKTFYSLYFLNKGFSYICDDTGVIGKDGNIYAYPTYSSIGYHDFLKFIKPKDIGYMNYLRYLPKTWFLSKFKVMEKFFHYPEVFLPDFKNYKIANRAKVKIVCLLGIGKKEIRELNVEEALRKIMIINSYSLPRIDSNPVLQTYFYLNNMDLSMIKEKEREILKSFLSRCKCYEVICEKNDVSDVIKWLEGELNVD